MQTSFKRSLRLAATAAGFALACGAQASTLTILHDFVAADGASPSSPLLEDASGALYGTMSGTGETGAGEYGTLYKFAGGTLTTLYTFATSASPAGAIAMDGDGAIWGGTAFAGKTYTTGSVYRFDAANGLVTVHSFTGGADGALPLGGVSLDAAGTIYGSTGYGGDTACRATPHALAPGCGTLFTVDPSTLAFTTIHTFELDEGTVPDAPLLVSKGVAHGSTSGGYGSSPGLHFGLSTPFSIKTNGKHFQEVKPTQGIGFTTGLVKDAAGNLWGTASGDAVSVAGGLYKIDPAGTFTWVVDFALGAAPAGPLAIDGQGRLLGTNAGDGTAGQGSIYRFDPASGTLTTLYSFSDSVQGAYPHGGLVAGPQGTFYGLMLEAGPGQGGHGAIFSFRP